MLRAITRRVGLGREVRGLFECRICGTSVAMEANVCPSCGSAEIAHYEF